MPRKSRRICFVTGTRAEFGLMQRALRAIQLHRGLSLQIIATGMHLDFARGRSLGEIQKQGLPVDAVVPWRGDSLATATGHAMAGIANALLRLRADITLVVGDRVEAFAAASASQLLGIPVAHVHGGDRALGQVDDALRHAITKLSHLHFAATKDSADRIFALGEDRWRIHNVGAPGIDGIAQDAVDADALPTPLRPREFTLGLLHPTTARANVEFKHACEMVNAALNNTSGHLLLVHPNNDPGAQGILKAWQQIKSPRMVQAANLSRGVFLAAMRDAALLIGNSSSGIIEAASFGTPVINLGSRQQGRLASTNVCNFDFSDKKIEMRIGKLWHQRYKNRKSNNVYGGSRTAVTIANRLFATALDDRLMKKLIRY